VSCVLMSRPDVSDPALIQAFDDVRNDKTPTNWVLYGYVPKTDKIKIDCTGEGTALTDMTDNISEGKIHYGFFRFNINGVYKFVLIAWCGENVIGMQKGKFNGHSTFMSQFLHGFHVQINARNEADLDEAKILQRLKTATGSHGRKNEKSKNQAAESTPAPSHTDAGTATGHTRSVNKDDSDKFWAQQRQDETADKTRREQEANANRTQIHGGASALRGRFENPQPQEQQARAPVNTGAGRAAPRPGPPAQQSTAPPVRQAGPPAVRAAPPPVVSAPPPAPEPEPAYEEPAYEEPAYEEPAQSWNAEPEPEPAQTWNAEPEPEPAYEEPAHDAGYGGDDASGGGGAGGGLFQCKALYDYTPENPGDLAFQEGDILSVLDDSDPSGWWSGEMNGVQGYFPSNFVEKC